MIKGQHRKVILPTLLTYGSIDTDSKTGMLIDNDDAESLEWSRKRYCAANECTGRERFKSHKLGRWSNDANVIPKI